MPRETICKRDELYHQIWAAPAQEVAKRYGISGTALAKICKKLNVPRPGRGYWAKKAAGQKVKQTPLPSLKPGQQTEFEITGRLDQTAISDEAKEQIAHERADEARIEVSPTLEAPHALVALSAPLLRAASEKSEFVWRRARCLDLRVSATAIDRALRLADAMVKALEARGFTVEVTEPVVKTGQYGRDESVPSSTRVLIGDERIEFRIEERIERVEVPPEKPYGRVDELLGRPRPEKKMEDKPSGRLTFLIVNAHAGFRYRWLDGKKQRIEISLNDIVRGLITMAEARRASKSEHERWQQQQREEERRRAEEAERQRRLQQRVADLNSRVADWVAARNIYEFAAAVQHDAECRGGAIDAQSDLGQWLAWARRYADAFAADALQTVLKLRPERPAPPSAAAYYYSAPSPYPFWLRHQR